MAGKSSALLIQFSCLQLNNTRKCSVTASSSPKMSNLKGMWGENSPPDRQTMLRVNYVFTDVVGLLRMDLF